MTIYQEYARAKQAIKALTIKIKELEPKILEEIKDLSEPMKTDNGTFTTVTRISYKFPEDVVKFSKDITKDAKERIKKIEDSAIKKGLAEKVEFVNVRYIELKKETK